MSTEIISDSAFYNRYGSLRLNFVRKYYGLRTDTVGSYVSRCGIAKNIKAKIQLKPLFANDLQEITDLYVTWRDLDERMPVRLTFKDTKSVNLSDSSASVDKWIPSFNERTGRRAVRFGKTDIILYEGFRSEWYFIKSCKRGNDVYIKEVNKKFKPLLEMEPLIFFDTTINNSRKINRYTNMIYVTGTVDPKLLSMEKAWLGFGSFWNDFITNIKKQFKGVVYIRAWQSQANGYPHWHAIMYFKNVDFSAVPNLDNDKRLSWRISTRQKLHRGDKLTIRQRIKNAWKIGNIDIECVPNTHECFKDLLKYVTRDLEGGESDLTNAMVWYFGKQSFAISKDFIKKIWGKNKNVALDEPDNADLINAISSNSNSGLVSIEVLPILPADFFVSFWQTSLADWSVPADPPPELVDRLEGLLSDCRVSVRRRDDGVKIIVYKREG